MPHRRRFRTGEQIPYSGIYKVFHASHRLPHEVTLLDGEIFPRCLKCDSSVEFQLIQQVSNILDKGAFRVVLFGLPTTDEAVQDKVATGTIDPATSTDSPDKPTADRSDLPVTTHPDALPDNAEVKRTKHVSLRKFRPGDLVPEHGIYTVEHGSHGLSHQATLAKDALFPRCRTCGSAVRFRLLRLSKPGSVVSPLSSSILEELDKPNPPSTKVG